MNTVVHHDRLREPTAETQCTMAVLVREQRASNGTRKLPALTTRGAIARGIAAAEAPAMLGAVNSIA
jgi:hypothetical protein